MSRFLPSRPVRVTIYAQRCRHFLSFFLLFRCATNLGICEATRDSSGASSKKREKKAGLHSKEPSNWDSLQMRPVKDADPELRHNNSLMLVTGSSTWHLMADEWKVRFALTTHHDYIKYCVIYKGASQSDNIKYLFNRRYLDMFASIIQYIPLSVWTTISVTLLKSLIAFVRCCSYSLRSADSANWSVGCCCDSPSYSGK